MAKNKKLIMVINGPNLNLLGEREPEIYGSQNLEALNRELAQHAQALGLDVSFFQSNHEGALIDAVQQAKTTSHGLIINPAGYGHVSIALRDALAAYPHPVIEVHISNIYQREAFRHHSYVSTVVTGVICGLGAQGYHLALTALHELLTGHSQRTSD